MGAFIMLGTTQAFRRINIGRSGMPSLLSLVPHKPQRRYLPALCNGSFSLLLHALQMKYYCSIFDNSNTFSASSTFIHHSNQSYLG